MTIDVTNHLKRRIVERRDVPFGTWSMVGSASAVEAVGHCGFDFLVIDMEHVPIEVRDLAELLRAIGNTPADPLVRISWNDKVTIKRVLDAGAQTIMVPFVETAEEAAEAVAAAKYPPQGVRGMAAVHRASRYGAAGDYLKRANDETCVIVQLETAEAIGRIREIAAVPGVDGVFVGPGDLATSLGHIGNIAHEHVQTLIARAAKEAAELRRPIGIVGPTPEMVRRFLDYGYTFAALASDMAFMTSRARSALGELRDREKTPDKAPTSAY